MLESLGITCCTQPVKCVIVVHLFFLTITQILLFPTVVVRFLYHKCLKNNKIGYIDFLSQPLFTQIRLRFYFKKAPLLSRVGVIWKRLQAVVGFYLGNPNGYMPGYVSALQQEH